MTTDAANCVRVFEVADDLLEATRDRTLSVGAKMMVDFADHHDGVSYVLADPTGTSSRSRGS